MDPKQALQKAEDTLKEYNSSVPKSLFRLSPKPHGKGMKKVKSVKARDGGTFEVYERPAKAGQDRYQMYHAFGTGRGLDLGTHPSADGALKFARNNGIIESADEHIAAMNKLRLANKNKWWNYSSPDGSVKAKGYNTWVQRIEVTKNGKTYKASTTMDAPVSKFKAELKQILESNNLDEAKETSIDLARRVAKNHQHEKGLDATTANVIMQVYNAVSDANKAKMEKLSVKQLASIAFKLVK